MERVALAGLEASAKAEDPELADRLAARPKSGWQSRLPFGRPGSATTAVSSKWLPALLVVAGLAASLWTVAVSTWAAGAAALVVTAGLWLAVEGYKARAKAKVDRESSG